MEDEEDGENDVAKIFIVFTLSKCYWVIK